MHFTASIVFTLLLIAPLYVWPEIYRFGYDQPRLPVVMGLAAIALAIMGVRAMRRRELSGGRDPVLLAGTALLGLHLLSLAGACAPWDGTAPILVLACGVATYAFARSGCVPRAYVFRAGLWSVAALGLAVAVIGILQKYALAPVPPVSTEGNINFSGALSAMLLPPAIALTLTRSPGGNRALAALAAAALFVLLVLTEARGGLVGAGVGVLVAGAVLVRRRVPRAVPIFALVLLALVAVPVITRGASHFSEERAKTASLRFEIWKSSVGMVAARPILGVGAGNFQAIYPEYRSEAEFAISNSPDGLGYYEVEDPHSSWVQVAVETGVPGLLAFLAILVFAFRSWHAGLKSAPDEDHVVALAGLAGGAVAYLGAGLFYTLTQHASHTVLFWAFLGLIGLAGEARPATPQRLAAAAPLAACIAALFGTFIAGRLAWVDYHFTLAVHPREARKYEFLVLDRIDLYEKILEVHPRAWRVRYELGASLSQMGRQEESVHAFREALKLHPNHLPTLVNLPAAILQSAGDSKEAEACLRRAVALAPYYYKTHYHLGIFEAASGRAAEAKARFLRTVELEPLHIMGHYCLGETYLQEDDVPRALEHFRIAQRLTYPVGKALRQDHPELIRDPRFAELFR